MHAKLTPFTRQEKQSSNATPQAHFTNSSQVAERRPLRFGPAAATQHQVLSLCSSARSKGVSCDSPTLDATSK